jgi:DNA processing protein
MSVLDDQRLARAFLMRIAEPPMPALTAYVRDVGPIVAAERIRTGTCPAEFRRDTAAHQHHTLAEHDLTHAQDIDARLVIPEDDEWPTVPFRAHTTRTDPDVPHMTPPLGLWVRGALRLDVAAAGAVTVVGARAATGYGEHIAAELGYGLGGHGTTVISGAGYGIDVAAHQGALAAEGTTVAVLAAGVDIRYPAGHARLLDRIAEQGLLVSEYPPGTPPGRHRFARRAAILGVVSAGTVVVEAGIRSSAISAARAAKAAGRVVMAVPGPVGSTVSWGCHELIRNSGATLVTSVGDIVETLAAQRPAAPPR